jgi:hypothetical protein
LTEKPASWSAQVFRQFEPALGRVPVLLVEPRQLNRGQAIVGWSLQRAGQCGFSHSPFNLPG